MSIYEIIKNVIESKNYELSDILAKIEKRCFEHQLTEEQRDELVALARENANPQNSLDLVATVLDLEQRIRKLENAKTNETEDSEEGTEEIVSYPEYVSGMRCYNGDKYSFKGKNFECIAPVGVVCVWNPDEYPSYWNEITE